MKNIYKLYVSTLLGSAVLGLLIQFALRLAELDIETLSIFLLAVFILLAHLPTLFPIKTVRKRLLASSIGIKYPEIIFCALVFFSWVILGTVSDHIWTGVLLGAGIAIIIGLGYGAVRIYTISSKALDCRAAPNPSTGLAALHSPILRYAYVLRAFAGAISLVSALHVLTLNGVFTFWPLISIVFCSLAAVVLSVVGFNISQRQALGAQRTARAALAYLEKSHGPADVLFYCSDKATAKHLRIKALVTGMNKEGLRTAIAAREASAVNKVEQFGATYVWPVPYLAGTDAVARPGLRAVFYTHDGAKNGHFTRFSQYAHVLDAKSGMLAKAKSLSSALNMYDYVIAPTPKVAATWRLPLSEAMAAKILTLDLCPLAPAFNHGQTGPESNVALCLPSAHTTYEQVSPKIMAGVAALVARYRRTGEEALADLDHEIGDVKHINLRRTSRLFLSVATNKRDKLTPWHKKVLAMSSEKNMPLVSHHIGHPKTVWNKADILCTTTLDQVVMLRATGKPLIWLGDGDAPEGATPFDPTSDLALHEIAQCPTPAPLHFTSYQALLDHVDKSGATSGDNIATQGAAQ